VKLKPSGIRADRAAGGRVRQQGESGTERRWREWHKQIPVSFLVKEGWWCSCSLGMI
jgi:hypothetical protein